MFQQQQLAKAHGEVYTENGDSLTDSLVAKRYNENHLAAGGTGFGCKISPERVQKESRKRGQSIVGSHLLHLQSQSQPPQPHYYNSMFPPPPPPVPELTMKQINSTNQKELRRFCSERSVTQHVPKGGNSIEILKKRLYKHYNYVDPYDISDIGDFI